MDIATITGIVASRLAQTQTSVTQLISDAQDYISDALTTSEMQFLPAITVNTTSEFRPSEQQAGEDPPIQSGEPDGPPLPGEPPALVLHDYFADAPIDLSKASAFQDISYPTADSPKISTGEDGGTQSASIADIFMKAVKYEISNAAFDSGYVDQVRAGLGSRSSIAADITGRVASRISLMGLRPPTAEMQTLAGYHQADDVRTVSNKQRESKVENDKNMVETAIRLSEILYRHADAVYARALEVAKTMIEIGDAVYQLQIGIERSATGVAKVAMATDFEVVDAEEEINKLNLKIFKENIKMFGDTADLAIKSLQNINGQYESKVSRYGLIIDKAKALAGFDMSKGRLSEEALVERVSIAIQNAANALGAFITIARSRQYAVGVGESVYSEAIRGAFEARNTLVQIGKKDATTTTG
jgi:hypothetical protein